MKTNNIVSTPNITGNIGSCETKTVETQTGSGFLTADYNETLTNSCTGQILQQYNYSSPWTPFTVFFLPFLIILAIIIVALQR